METLKYWRILLKAKINKKLQRRYFIFNDSYESIAVKRFSDYYLTELSNMIYFFIDANMAKEKKVLLKLITRLVEKGKKVYLYEEVKTFSDEDITYLYKLSNKIMFFDKYIEISHELASNQILEIDAASYALIIDKLNYFQKICKKYCKNDLDQVIFSAVQISNYVKYSEETTSDSCLTSCFLQKRGVCIDISIALWKCLDRLNIQNAVIKGIGNINSKPNLSGLVRFDHAWNQIKIEDKWYNLDLTWYMSLKNLDFFLVKDEIFYVDNMHKTTIRNHYCKTSVNPEYIQGKINEYNKYKNVFEQYDKGIKDIELKLK